MKKKYKNISDCLVNFHTQYAIEPHKLTWIIQDKCYICDKPDQDVYTYHVKFCYSYRFGYIACNKCKVLLDIYKDISQENGTYVKNTMIINKDIKFYRVSRTCNIPPYIQEGYLEPKIQPVFIKEGNKLITTVNWNELNKNIPLSNLIFFNRNIYGYSIKEGPFKECKSIWKKELQDSYKVANNFFHFYKFALKHTIFDMLVIVNICKYWVSDLI